MDLKNLEPTPEVIDEIKKSYNRLHRRKAEAEKYLDRPDISQLEKSIRVPAFRVEVIEPMEIYLQALIRWGIEVSPDDILNGFKVKNV